MNRTPPPERPSRFLLISCFLFYSWSLQSWIDGNFALVLFLIPSAPRNLLSTSDNFVVKSRRLRAPAISRQNGPAKAHCERDGTSDGGTVSNLAILYYKGLSLMKGQISHPVSPVSTQFLMKITCGISMSQSTGQLSPLTKVGMIWTPNTLF